MASVSLARISLQALEAFERVAQSGSMQAAAREMGLSISSVSSHVSRLEEQMGVTLLDRSRRPFVPTREGKEALHHLSRGLHHLRQATSETAIAGLHGTRSLCIGIVEDFESSVTPELAVVLASRMPRAKLSLRNVLSHEAPALLRSGALDAAIVSEAESSVRDLHSAPLLRDPFVIAMPGAVQVKPESLVKGQVDLPFLRFNPDHLIGKQIDAHLARNRVSLPERYAFDSAQSIMAIIADGGGWSIMTPLGFMRAQRYSGRVRLQPLPLASFARRITLLSRPGFDDPTAQAIAALVRQIAGRTVLDPFGEICPWLSDSFMLLGNQD